MYDQQALAFVLNIKLIDNLNKIKSEMVNFIRIFGTDDKIYILNEHGDFLTRKSQIIGLLSLVHSVLLEDLIKDSVAVLDSEFHCVKKLIILNDQGLEAYQKNKLNKLTAQNKCKFYIIENFENLSQELKTIYEEKDGTQNSVES